MKALTLISALILCASTAYARHKHDTWLSIFKSEDGFLFQGDLERTGFSFDIPGQEIQALPQEDASDVARTVIDDVFFAVQPVKASEFPSTDPDILVSYRKSEQQYQKEQFGRVKLSELDVCEGTALEHQSWALEALDLDAPAQAYMVVEVGNYVILVSSAFTNAEEKEAMLSKFSGFCESFKTG